MARAPLQQGRDRLACVDVPALPLQLLLRRHPEWRGHPAAVVEEERPQALVRWVNEQARAARVLPGLRYAAALSLAPDLRAGALSERELRRANGALVRRLRGFTPGVEAAPAEPGVFWLDATGLHLLYPSLDGWAGTIRGSLREVGLEANLAVGFTRFGTYAVVKSRGGTCVLEDREAEARAAGEAQLERLGLEPALRDALGRLGIRTLEGFLSLPAEGLLQRFGGEAYRLHALASGDLLVPLQPLGVREPLVRRQRFEPPEADATRLLFVVKRLLHPLLAALAARGQALVELALHLELEDAAGRTETLRPAAATLDTLLVLELVRLRLEAVRLEAAAVELTLAVRGETATSEQLRLFEVPPLRDLDAAGRALARVRAEFGDEAVVRASLRAGHLPEARFVWQPLVRLAQAEPLPAAAPALVRRLHAPARPLAPDVALAGRRVGPYVVSGGWWVREVHRDYHFVETEQGEVFWIYFDRKRQRWFVQAKVE